MFQERVFYSKGATGGNDQGANVKQSFLASATRPQYGWLSGSL